MRIHQTLVKDESLKKNPPPYDPIRHPQRVHSAVQRVRQTLARLDVKLLLVDGVYKLDRQCFVLRPSKVQPERKRGIELREKLLNYVQDSGFVTTADLCQHFSMSRQALRKHTSRLLQELKLTYKKRGRLSGYQIQTGLSRNEISGKHGN